MTDRASSSFQYDSRDHAHADAVMVWENAQTHSQAFLQKFLHTKEPGHADAYTLCALAKSFPLQFLEDQMVIRKSEVVLSENTTGEGWNDEILNLRDILLNYVQWNKEALLAKAAKQLGIPFPIMERS